MDLSLSPVEREFRDAVRGWIEANHPGREPDSDPEQFEFRKAWQRALNDRGWAGLNWPTEYGGAGATQVEQAIFYEELARAGAPSMANVLGLAMGGPTVIAHGTDEQKQRYLPPILSADEIWCQGFSEPESGSDLASLKTRAVRNGDEWVVTGQKVWTTYAHEAKWCMLVARTDTEAPKHRGLTYFLLDMEQDGVEVRPLVQITGESEFNELFLEEARVPHENIVGGEGNGWSVAITTLMHERAGLAFALQVRVQVALRELRDLIREAGLDGDPVIRQRYGQLVAEAQVLRLTAYRGLTRDAPGPRGVARQVALGRGQPVPDRAGDGRRGCRSRDGPWQYRFLRARANSIEGGTTEILRNIVAERVLGSAAGLVLNFDLSEDQRTIKSTAREFLAARYPLAEVRRLALEEERGFTDRQWDEMVELGWPEIAELGTVELVVLAEELGYALAPTPLPSTWAAGLFGAPLDGRGALVVDGLAADAALRRRARRLGRRPDHGRGRRAGRVARPHAAAVPGQRRLARAARRRRRARAAAGDGHERRRLARRRPAGDGAGRGLRQGAQAVRPRDRHLPGRLARLRADAARGGGRALGRVLGGVGARPRAGDRPAGHRLREGLRGRRRPARSALGAPGPRRHRLHLGARPALLPQARRGQRPPVRVGGVAPRDDRRAEPVAPPARITSVHNPT